MKIHIVGAGTPVANGDRHGSSYVIQRDDDYLMFDCGPATTNKLAKMGIRPKWIDNLVFTHHHFDHNADYPCFLLTRWEESIGGENQLRIFGPDHTERLTHLLMDREDGAYAPDWIARINHPLSLNAYQKRGGKLPRKPPQMSATDIDAGDVIEGPDWVIRTAPADHVQPWLDSIAYRMESDAGTVVVTGDTGPCDSVRDLAADADVMISICTYVQDDIDGTPEARYQCGSRDVASIAQAAGVGMLVLVHQVHHLDAPGQMERALRDITSIYDGDVVWSHELMTIDIT
ncbi:MAG: MBL fold metallo-hydrolase [Acidimicrobiia bacterium]|nr:MBL fold metallo-hydrolase [Acidimicrobiia bacterium]